MTLGPRLMVRTASLAATKLIQPGSQIRYRYRVLLRKGLAADAWSKTLLEKFPRQENLFLFKHQHTLNTLYYTSITYRDYPFTAFCKFWVVAYEQKGRLVRRM